MSDDRKAPLLTIGQVWVAMNKEIRRIKQIGEFALIWGTTDHQDVRLVLYGTFVPGSPAPAQR